jgi:hypothetical protein
VDLRLVHDLAQCQREATAPFGVGNLQIRLPGDVLGAGNHFLVGDFAHGDSSCRPMPKNRPQSNKRPPSGRAAALGARQHRRRFAPADAPERAEKISALQSSSSRPRHTRPLHTKAINDLRPGHRPHHPAPDETAINQLPLNRHPR